MSAHDLRPRFAPGMRVPVAFEPIAVGEPVEIKGQKFTVVARTKRGLALRRVSRATHSPKQSKEESAP